VIWHRVRAQEADPMMYDKFFADAISRLRDERRYRVFADLERIARRFPWAVWHSPQRDMRLRGADGRSAARAGSAIGSPCPSIGPPDQMGYPSTGIAKSPDIFSLDG
jgi:hypothetical protein